MPVLETESFKRDLKKSKALPAVVLILGNEEALAAEALEHLKAAFRGLHGDASPDFNLDVLHADRDGCERILESACTLPLGSALKLTVVHRLEKLPESAHASLADYCGSPNPSTCLVLIWNAKPDKKTLERNLPAAVSRAGTLVKCWKMFDSQKPQWVREKMAAMGKTLSFEAAELLAQEGGDSLYELQSEMEKLFLFAGGRKEIGLQDVQATMSFKPDASVWNVAAAVEAGDFKKAAQTLRTCLEQGEEPLFILNTLARTCRKTVQEREAFAFGGYNKQAPIHPAVKAGVARALPRILARIQKADLMLKSGQGAESAVFERLLWDLKMKCAAAGTKNKSLTADV